MKTPHLCTAFLLATVVAFGVRDMLNAGESAPEAADSGFAQAVSRRDGTAADEKKRLRWREGKRLIDHGGHFRQDGDGATFVSETGHELVALANLNLERVTRTLKAADEPESIRWSVNGVVTEFNGQNYLLIQRAVYKSASPPPLPEQILN